MLSLMLSLGMCMGAEGKTVYISMVYACFQLHLHIRSRPVRYCIGWILSNPGVLDIIHAWVLLEGKAK